jgi:hypothetical protein
MTSSYNAATGSDKVPSVGTLASTKCSNIVFSGYRVSHGKNDSDPSVFAGLILYDGRSSFAPLAQRMLRIFRRQAVQPVMRYAKQK